MNILIGIFIVLHGLVHLLYFGQSAMLFELQSELVWPERSWAFSRYMGAGTIRILASVSCVVAAIGFVSGGLGVLANLAWWRPMVTASAVFSSALYIFFWDGKVKLLDGKGGVGLLINLGILLEVLATGWLTAAV